MAGGNSKAVQKQTTDRKQGRGFRGRSYRAYLNEDRFWHNKLARLARRFAKTGLLEYRSAYESVMARALQIGTQLMDDSIASARREEAIEQAECVAAAEMRRPDAIYAEIKAVIDKHKDEMAALCEIHCTDALDISCMVENLTDWHAAIQRDVRRGCFTGALEWMA